VKTGYTSSVHVSSPLLWEMHDGFEPKALELGHALDTDTWPMPAAVDGPAPPMRHELKHGRAALSYRAEEKPAERSFVDGQGFKFVILTDGSGLEVAKARIAPIGWHDEEPAKDDKRQGVIPGTKPASAQEPAPAEAEASKLKKPRKPREPKALQLEASTETKRKKPRKAKASKGKGKPKHKA